MISPLREALDEPNGLMAVGGELSPQRLLAAYRRGIFPWYEEPQPVLWWTPDPRSVLFPLNCIFPARCARPCARTLPPGRGQRFSRSCASAPAARRWPGHLDRRDMIAAYSACTSRACPLDRGAGQAGSLVGGLYGVALGRVFFGESMFSRTAMPPRWHWSRWLRS